MTINFRHKAAWLLAAAVIIPTLILLAASTTHALTLAGTVVSNQADVTYKSLSGTHTANSNVSSFTVQELLDHSIVTVDIANVSTPAASTGQYLSFQLLNNGNGNDTYSLMNTVIAGSDFSPSLMQIYFDTDNSGTYNAGDTLYTPAANDPTLAAGTTLRIFVVCTVPAGVLEGDLSEVRLTITSKEGTGPTGTKLPTKGDAGTDAIIGGSQGSSSATSKFEIASRLVMVKTATTVDPKGGNLPMSGSEVKYTITVNVSGGGTLNNVKVIDTVPAHTKYKAGTLSLNGTALSDPLDADKGDFGVSITNGITVNWTTLKPSDGTQTVRFSVLID